MLLDSVVLKEVSHVYVNNRGAFLAVEHMNLNVKQGEFVSLIGPSGCGKTTLLSLISGLLTPTVGTVSVAGEPVSQPTSKVGYMLQQDYLFPWLTIYENASIGLELMGRTTAADKEIVNQLLSDMGLSHALGSYPHQLSGGMRQRVALVRTLATEPDTLLLDEPFSALDYQTKLQLEDLVASTLSALNKTVILVTHDITEAIAMSDRIIVLQANPGRIRTEIEVPKAIREALPLTAREKPGFHELFHELWKHLEEKEVYPVDEG